MSNTAVNIYKLLFQAELTLEDMQSYLEVEKTSIIKSMSQINEFLESLKLPIIKKIDDRYSLHLTKEEWNVLFDNFKSLTTDEKIDYLYVKFISNGFLNLEKEKEILDVSRSTILRCFQIVKDEFSKNGSKYEYLHGKGLVLTELSKLDKIIFYKRVMKLFIEEDTLVPLGKELLDSLKSFDTKVRVKQLYDILKTLDVSLNYFLLSFLCSLEICIEIFDDFNFKRDEHYSLPQFEKIQTVVNIHGSNFNDQYKEQIVHFILSLKENTIILETELKSKTFELIKILKDKFNIKNEDKILNELLFQKIYLGLFKYENKILKVKAIKFDNLQKILLNKFEDSIKELSYDFYPVDKFAIVYVLRRMIIDDNFKKIKNVLLLSSDVTASEQVVLKTTLKREAPHIKFDMEGTFLHKKDIMFNENNYDLIISDEKINSRVITLDFYNNAKVLDILENHAFKIGIDNLNYL